MRKAATGMVLIFLLCISLCGIKSVYAWFISSDEQHNYFTTGMNDVEIKEEFPDPDIRPGETVKKKVEFTNTGKVPCYVRARYFYSTSEAEEQTVLEFGTEGWKQDADGYYYYAQSVLPGEKTKPFLTAVKIKEGGELVQNFDLTVYTETVQAENHKSAKEAFAHLGVKEGKE